MTLQVINLGDAVNDGSGDDLRTAFEKIVFNFNDLDTRITDDTTIAINVGSEGVGVLKAQVGDELQFKKLVENNYVSIVENENTLTIGLDFQSTVDFNSQNLSNIGDVSVLGSINLNGPSSYLYGNVVGILDGVVMGTVYAATNPVVAQGNVVGRNGLITNPADPNYAPALVDGVNVLELNNAATSFDFGTIGEEVYVIDPSLPGEYFGVGLSTIKRVFNNPVSYLLDQIGTDMGTIMDPSPYIISNGSI